MGKKAGLKNVLAGRSVALANEMLADNLPQYGNSTTAQIQIHLIVERVSTGAQTIGVQKTVALPVQPKHTKR